jgi:hypothetical protein
MVRAIQPHILFNGRNGLPGDFGTPGRWPGSTLAFAGLECRLRGVTLLGSNLPVRFTQSGGRVLLTGLPDDPPDPVCPVLRFDFDRPPSVYLTGGLRTPRVPHPHYDPCPSDLMHGTDGPAFHTASASTQGEPTMTTSLAAAHSAKVKLAGVTVHLGEPMQAAESIGRVWFPTTAQFPTGELLLT